MNKRKFIISNLVCIALLASAQVPEKFKYQAVVRNNQNVVMANQPVSLRISILNGSSEGEINYSELHNITTSPMGLADLQIGEGGVVSGSFSDISWGSDLYFLKVEMDPSGGTSFEHMGTTQLISVPYALYSANLASPTTKFSIREEVDHASDSALFEVKNKEGQVLFAVYPEGTRIFILDEITKGPNSGFAVSSSSSSGEAITEYLNVSGQSAVETVPGENRVAWYPKRNAFLAGNVLVESADSVGQNSIATGYQSKAIGNYSEAFGHQSIARGKYSTAIGKSAIAQSINSVSIGNHSLAEDTSSFAFGTGAIASGVNSYAIGSSGVDSAGIPTGNTRAIGEQSFALGMGSLAEGFGSFSIGTNNRALGDYSMALGIKTLASEAYSTTLGKQTMASGKLSTAMGLLTNASGITSTAMGGWTTASGPYSTATGRNTIASGKGSFTMGTHTTANGSQSAAMGRGTIARSFSSLSIGSFNDTVTTSVQTFWKPTDPLFIIGNGRSDTTRHNAMMVKKNGELYLPHVYEDVIVGDFRDLQIDSTGKIGYVVSSRRYKSAIESMEDVGWLYELRPVNFVYISDYSETTQYGLIAEEVEEVNPAFVNYNKKGEAETVYYSQLIAPILKALQEQNKVIETLQAKIEALENKK